MPVVDLDDKQTTPGLKFTDEININKECVSAAAANANIKRNNSQPTYIKGVDQGNHYLSIYHPSQKILRYPHHIFQMKKKQNSYLKKKHKCSTILSHNCSSCLKMPEGKFRLKWLS